VSAESASVEFDYDAAKECSTPDQPLIHRAAKWEKEPNAEVLRYSTSQAQQPVTQWILR